MQKGPSRLSFGLILTASKVPGTVNPGLTPRFLDQGITFKEAKYTLVCRKLFRQQLAVENIPTDVVSTYYKNDAPHDMYIAEVIEIRTRDVQ